MPSNSGLKDTIVIGGLSILGFMAGGKLGSMFGAVIGTIACSIFNGQQPIEASESPVNTLPHTSNSSSISNYRLRISKRNLSKDELTAQSTCSICLELFTPSIYLWPCLHRCFCDNCFNKVRRNKVTSCPICRKPIIKFNLI